MTASSLHPSTSELVSLTVSDDGPEVVVAAAGEIDSTSAPVVRRRLEALLDAGVRQLTVDLTGVSFLDSAGLCVLAATHRRALREDVRMRVLASSRAVIRPLQITGLWALLHAEQVTPGEQLQQGVGVA